MASACLNGIGMAPEKFLDCPTARYSSYGWLSPRISFTHEFPDEELAKTTAAEFSTKNHPTGAENVDAGKPECLDPDISSVDFGDFEFHLEDPVPMLTADELFADGKLMPLHLSSSRREMISDPTSSDMRLQEPSMFLIRNEVSSTDPYMFSPKAPTCSSRWKELLGLKKFYQNSHVNPKTVSGLSANNNRNTATSLKQFLHRDTESAFAASIDSSINLPLLKDLGNKSESVSVSSRLSLFSSSGHEHDDLPKLSLDSEKPTVISRNMHQTTRSFSNHRPLSSETQIIARAGGKSVRKAPESTVPVSGAAVDSPRMNS